MSGPLNDAGRGLGAVLRDCAHAPFYRDEYVTLFHADARDLVWVIAADVMVTDPPYGIGWRRGLNKQRASKAHAGILNDGDTSMRDDVLALHLPLPAVVFGSFYAPPPAAVRQVLVWHKPPDAGVVGSTTGFRRDVEPVYLCGDWPTRPVASSAVLRSTIPNIGNPSSPAGKTGHPHAKPLDLMETLILACPEGWIIDPFAGSGSTLVAAKNLGRRAVGIELDERYCETAARRLSQGVLDLGAA